MSVIGLDVGTSRVKAVRFDASWTAADSEAEATRVLRGEDGAVREQDMPDVWSAAADVVRAVAQRAPDRVEYVALTAQGDGCWLVDDAGEPVGRAMLWNDSRAGAIVEDWARDGTLERAFLISGCYGAPGLASAQLHWLAEHESQQLDRAAALLSCGSWIYSRLTGALVLESSDAANPFFDARSRHYDDRLLDLFGLAEQTRLLPRTVQGSDRVGALSDTAAHATGLPAGTPVVLAPYDVAATAIGTGVVRPGQSFGVLGTTLCVGTVSDDPQLDRDPNGMTLPGIDANRWLIAYATMSGTEVLDWVASLVGAPDAGGVSELAARSTHPDPPLLLPYLSPAGERSPFLDARARGTITGLELSHGPADLARAALDGLSLAVLDCLTAAGRPPAQLALSGGGSRSELWCQTIADAVGVPVLRADVEEVGARGAVLSAAADLGMFDSLDAAVDAVVRPGTVHEPDAARTQWYADRYETYLATREALRPAP